MKKTQLLLSALTLVLSFCPIRAQTSCTHTTEKVVVVGEGSGYDIVAPVEPQATAPIPPVDLSTISATQTYSHPEFTLGFPTEYWVDNKEGLEIAKCIGTGYSLTSIVCPMGIEEIGIPEITSEERIRPLLDTRKDVTIGGLVLKSYEAIEGNYEEEPMSCKVYTLNSGEKTYLFIEASVIPSQWWPNHLSWNFDGKTTKSSTQLLSEFNDFLNGVFKSETNNEIKISEEGNSKEIRITIKADYNPFSKRKAAKTLSRLTHTLTLFKGFADKEYDFTLEFYDGEKSLQGTCTLPHCEYFQWNEHTRFRDLDKEHSSSTMEQPERAIGG